MAENLTESTAFVGISPNDNECQLTFANGETELVCPVSELAKLFSLRHDLIAVCADAADLARRTAVLGAASGQARVALLRLARDRRLVCLTAARHVADTARHPRLELPDEVAGTIPDDAAAIAAAGRRIVVFLSSPFWNRWLQSSVRAAERTGPLGLAVRVRAQVTCGLVGTNGLRPDPKSLPEVIEELRRIADIEFRRLVGYSGAAECFKGGKKASPDKNGFRPTYTDKLKTWLGEVADSVLDRWGVPVPRNDLRDGWPDRQLRNWPLWALGAGPLTQLRDLQAAEYLQDQLAGSEETVLYPAYTASPHLSTHRPDLLAYRRFRVANRVPPAFVPRAGHRFVRIAMEDLPVRALAATLEQAQPGSRFARALNSGRRAGEVLTQALGDAASLSTALAEWIAVLTATGLGVEAVTVLSGWLSGDSLAPSTSRSVDRELLREFPELADHTADRSADVLAERMGATPDELRDWIRFDPNAARRGAGFLNQLQTSGHAWLCSHTNLTELLEYTRRRRASTGSPSDAYERLSLDIHKLRMMVAHMTQYHPEAVVTPTGRAYAGLGWVPARAAFLGTAEDALAEAMFTVLEAGHQVSALGQYEFVLEVAESDVERTFSDVLGRVRQSAGDALGGFPVRVEAEEIARW